MRFLNGTVFFTDSVVVKIALELLFELKLYEQRVVVSLGLFVLRVLCELAGNSQRVIPDAEILKHSCLIQLVSR